MKRSVVFFLALFLFTSCEKNLSKTYVESLEISETAAVVIMPETSDATLATIASTMVTQPKIAENLTGAPQEYITIDEKQYPIDSTELQRIVLCDSNKDFQEISKMKNIENLNLLIAFNNPDFTLLADLPKLKTIRVSSDADWPMDINSISELKNIESLTISNRSITDISEVPLGEMINLTSLFLDVSGDFTDLSPLSELRKLKSLSVYWHWGEGDVDMSPLTELNNLESLYLHGKRVSNYDLAKEMPNLKDFYYTPLTNFLGNENRADQYVVQWSRE